MSGYRKSPVNLWWFRRIACMGALVLVTLRVADPAWAQLADAPAGSADHAGDEASPELAILPVESLGADDLLEIRVSYCPELSRTFRVSSDGSLSLPLLHQKLSVAGLTPIQVAYILRQA